MNIYEPNRMQAAGTQAVAMDEGLRAYMLRVYNYMGSALALTGLVSYLAVAIEPLRNLLFITSDTGQVAGMGALGWVLLFVQLGMVIYLSARIHALSFGAAQGIFWAYAGLMGLSLSPLVIVYTGASIAKAFFSTAIVFGAMSLYGYTTKRDISGWGSFLFIGLIGVILASLVNIFLQSSGLDFALSVITVLVFVGLTAYDTQNLKRIYYSLQHDGEALAKSSIMGALKLYLDFINLFVRMLRFMGDRR